ncbi:MAG TPA: BsuPI-related putative proteinase inhibitor [Gemmatimonadaceae bacterium]|nr:BsuPI-related putative proteinase inhibitor [Gemmatimonadaceae bacterium]
MPNSPVILLISAACVAFASSSSVRKPAPNKSQVEHHRRGAQSLSSTFDINVKNGVQFNLHVNNNTGKMTELRFQDGRTHDFVVLDESGKEVWRWSNGRMFTQAMQSKLVKSNDSAVFANVWDGRNAHGKFTAVAILRAENHPVEERVEFALR